MLQVSRYISQRIQDGRRRIKLLIRGARDTQEVYESAPFGSDANIPEGYRALYMTTGQKGKAVMIGVINVNQLESLAPGEKSLYSTNEDGSQIQAFITMRNNGQLEVNGVGDKAVRFSELDSELQSFKTSIQQELTKIQTGLAGVGGVYTPGILTIDISAAEVDQVDLPS